MKPAGSDELEPLLAEQLAYFRALGLDYEDPAIWGLGGSEVGEALDSFRPNGDVLELACGTGMWTRRLLRHATTVTAVDAAPEMLAVAAARFGDGRVRFVEANLFTWTPDRRYDVVFFAFWLSHVPLERFEHFWSLVADCLEPHGRVFFVDDAYRTPDELIDGASSSTIRRRLDDGTAYRLVKVPYQPRDLEERLGRLGWRARVTPTSGPLFWGVGRLDLRTLRVEPCAVEPVKDGDRGNEKAGAASGLRRG
jgi:SAM-dependent methyltransferase